MIKAKKTTALQGVDSKIIMKEGNIANEIVKLAKNERCNLIIVGSKGLGATMRLFLGSVSNKLANNAPCSILIINNDILPIFFIDLNPNLFRENGGD